MRGWMIAMTVALLCVVPCRGLEVEGLDDLWKQAEAYGVEADADLDQGLSNLFSAAVAQVEDVVLAGAATGLKLLAVVLLCSLAEGTAGGKGGGLGAVELAGALSITALTMTDMAVMIGMGRETIGRIELFSGAVLPVMAVLTAAGGGVTAAAARQIPRRPSTGQPRS